MKDYISIIRKAEFIDLFKYGSIYIRYAVEFDGEALDVHANNKQLFDSLTSSMNMYEYSFEYLIIHFKADAFSTNIKINIKNVICIYSFDVDSMKEMSTSFDDRIEIRISPWSTLFAEHQEALQAKQNILGVENIWKIFNLEAEELEYCRKLIPEKDLILAYKLFRDNKKPTGVLPIWVYLLRYERHSFYPRDKRGFFCDALHAIMNYKANDSMLEDLAEEAPVYPMLKTLEKANFKELSEVFNTAPFTQWSAEISESNYWIYASMYYYMKAIFSEGLNLKAELLPCPINEFISYSRSFGEREFAIACYLLGFTFGYELTYDALYEVINPPFFKRKQNPLPPVKKPNESDNLGSQQDVENQTPATSDANNTQKDGQSSLSEVGQTSLFPDSEIDMNELITVYKGRLKKDGTPSKNTDVRKIPLSELEKYKKLKYKKINE